MIINSSPAVVDFVAPSDPGEPKTVWGIRPLTYRETQQVMAEAGRRPVAAMDLYLRTYQAPDHEETDEEMLARVKEQRAKAALYSDEDKQLMDEAAAYVTRHTFCTCSYGIQTIDGTRVSHPEVVNILDNMQPREQVGAVLAEIAAQIGELSKGSLKKKQP